MDKTTVTKQLVNYLSEVEALAAQAKTKLLSSQDEPVVEEVEQLIQHSSLLAFTMGQAYTLETVDAATPVVRKSTKQFVRDNYGRFAKVV